MSPQKSFIARLLHDNTEEYHRTPLRSEQYDLPKIREAIAANETGNIPERQKYAFRKFSGSKALGDDLGRYQVTEGELRGNAARYLGRQVTPEQFLADPQLQNAYMTQKIGHLLNDNVSLAGVYALHSQGMTGYGDPRIVQKKIDQSNRERNNYVKRALASYQRRPVDNRRVLAGQLIQ